MDLLVGVRRGTGLIRIARRARSTGGGVGSGIGDSGINLVKYDGCTILSQRCDYITARRVRFEVLELHA